MWILENYEYYLSAKSVYFLPLPYLLFSNQNMMSKLLD